MNFILLFYRLLSCLYMISSFINGASANIVNGYDTIDGKVISGVPCTNCKDGKCYCMAEKGDKVKNFCFFKLFFY